MEQPPKLKTEIKLRYIWRTRKAEKVLSMCLFRMASPYRPFSFYMDQLRRVIFDCSTFLPDYKIVLWIDKSIIPAELDLFRAKNIDIIEYHIPQFWNDATNTHQGTLGSSVRFLIFDNDLFDFRHARVRITADVDIAGGYPSLMIYRRLERMEANVSTVNFSRWPPWVSRSDTPFYLIGGYTCIKKSPLNKLKNQLEDYLSTLTTPAYGHDEIFLNSEILTNLKTASPPSPSSPFKVSVFRINSILSETKKIFYNPANQKTIGQELTFAKEMLDRWDKASYSKMKNHKTFFGNDAKDEAQYIRYFAMLLWKFYTDEDKFRINEWLQSPFIYMQLHYSLPSLTSEWILLNPPQLPPSPPPTPRLPHRI